MHAVSLGELILIFLIVVVLFGSQRLASLGKSLGEAIANFKKALNEGGTQEHPPQQAVVTTTVSLPEQTHMIQSGVQIQKKKEEKTNS